MNNYLLLGLSVLPLVALNQGHMGITNYVPIMHLHNKYIPNFILFSKFYFILFYCIFILFFILNLFYFILSPLPPLRKESHSRSVNTEFTRWDVDRNSLGRGIPSGNKDFNGLGLNREFPEGESQEGNSKMANGNSLSNCC